MLRATRLPWIAALAAPVLSCTLLVQFHDQSGDNADGGLPPGGDGGIDVASDVTVDAPDDSTGTDSEPPSEGAAVDNWNPCQMLTGWYCGNNGLAVPLPDADLVQCEGGSTIGITMCDAGCLHVVDPFPDSCNPCGGRTNGDYCGRDLSGFNPENADILIGCAGGQVGLQDACAHGCGSNGNMSACYP